MIKKKYPAITPEKKKNMMKKLSEQAKSGIFTLKKITMHRVRSQ